MGNIITIILYHHYDDDFSSSISTVIHDSHTKYEMVCFNNKSYLFKSSSHLMELIFLTITYALRNYE